MTKIDALTKTWLGETTEKVAVIHAAFEDAPTTVAFVEIDAALPIRKKLEIAFVKTNTITARATLAPTRKTRSEKHSAATRSSRESNRFRFVRF